jgi:hypothetical protein
VKPARRLAAVALVTAALLSACGSQAGSASVVGDHAISDAQVSDYTSELESQLSTIKGATFDEAKATQVGVSVLTRDALLTEVARRDGITVTQGDVDSFISEVIKGGSNGDRKAFVEGLARDSAIPESAIPAAARSQLIITAILARTAPGATDDAARNKALTDYLTPRVKAIGVEVSPRFGSWDVLSLGPVSNDLSTPLTSAGGGGASVAPSPTS